MKVLKEVYLKKAEGRNLRRLEPERALSKWYMTLHQASAKARQRERSLSRKLLFFEFKDHALIFI